MPMTIELLSANARHNLRCRILRLWPQISIEKGGSFGWILWIFWWALWIFWVDLLDGTRVPTQKLPRISRPPLLGAAKGATRHEVRAPAAPGEGRVTRRTTRAAAPTP